MLVIRQAQMRALQQSMERDFVVRKARWAVRRCGFADTPTLHDRIAQAAARAVRHGLTRDGDVHAFVELDLLYGSDFDHRYETAADILSRPDIDGSRKAEMLEDWELFERPQRELPTV